MRDVFEELDCSDVKKFWGAPSLRVLWGCKIGVQIEREEGVTSREGKMAQQK